MTSIDAFAEPSNIEALARGIDWSDGIAFYFLVADDPRTHDAAIEAVSTRLRRRRVRRLSLDVSTHDLLGRVRKSPRLRSDEVLVVTGLERVIDETETSSAPFIRQLNAARDAFRHVVPCPILFVVPRYVLPVLAAGAPDFFSTRSGLYFYEGQVAPEKRFHHQVQHVRPDLDAYERLERIEDVEALLAALPAFRRSPETRSMYFRLARRLTQLLTDRYDLSTAVSVASQAYTLAVDSEFLRQALEFASVLGQIAGLARDPAELDRWSGIVTALAEQIGDSASLLRAFWMKGMASEAMDRVEDAAAAYRRAAALAVQMQDHATAAQLEMALGNLQLHEGHAAEAVEHLRKSERFAIEAGERPLLAEIRWNITMPLLQLGRLHEAERSVTESIRELERLGDTVQLSMALIELGDVLRAQERFAEAESVYARVLATVQKSPILPSRLVPALLGLIDALTKQQKLAEAAGMIEGTLGWLDRLRAELPDTAKVESDLRELLARIREALPKE